MTGDFPILSMPFTKEDTIDVEDLEKEVEFAIKSGVNGVGIALASEIYKLTESERETCIKTVVNQVNQRIKIVINTTSLTTYSTILYSKQAKELGADALMISPPPGLPPEIIVEYYKTITKEVQLPIFIQDIDETPVSPPILSKLTEDGNTIYYAKVETTPTPLRMIEAKSLLRKNLILFGGAGGTFYLEELRLGSEGTMPACVIPDVFSTVWDLFQNNEIDKAEELFRKYAPLLKYLNHFFHPQRPFDFRGYLAKEALRLRGIFKEANVRGPAIKPDQFFFDEIKTLLEEVKLI